MSSGGIVDREAITAAFDAVDAALDGIFDKGKTLALYHTKRLASPAQRIVLYAFESGSTVDPQEGARRGRCRRRPSRALDSKS